MSKVKILVVEDEIVIADNICDILERLGYDVLEPVINYSEAIKALKTEKPDLALLDIQLAGEKDGIDLAFMIKEKIKIPFIFLTSNADPRTVGRAKTLNPPAYLVKPFNKDDLFTSIELALHNFSTEEKFEELEHRQVLIKDSLYIKDRHLFHKVKIEDILYLKSDHVYVEVHTMQEKMYLVRKTMGEFIKDMPLNFYRVHRSYAVNLEYMDAINSKIVIIKGVEIPLGKTNREELLKKLKVET